MNTFFGILGYQLYCTAQQGLSFGCGFSKKKKKNQPTDILQIGNLQNRKNIPYRHKFNNLEINKYNHLYWTVK